MRWESQSTMRCLETDVCLRVCWDGFRSGDVILINVGTSSWYVQFVSEMRAKNRYNCGCSGPPRYSFRELPKRFALLPFWYSRWHWMSHHVKFCKNPSIWSQKFIWRVHKIQYVYKWTKCTEFLWLDFIFYKRLYMFRIILVHLHEQLYKLYITFGIWRYHTMVSAYTKCDVQLINLLLKMD